MRLLVTRPFLLSGQRQEAGIELDVPDALGRELVASNKAVQSEPQTARSGPMTTATAAAVVPGKQPAPRRKKELPA